MTKNELTKLAMSSLVSGIRKDQYENCPRVIEMRPSVEELTENLKYDKDKLIETLVERVTELATGIVDNFAEEDWDQDVVKVEPVKEYVFDNVGGFIPKISPKTRK